MQSGNMSELNAQLILSRLQQTVSRTNARLLLDKAKIQSGMQVLDESVTLDADQAKALCLSMIKQGGPAFQVGQAIYKEYLM